MKSLNQGIHFTGGLPKDWRVANAEKSLAKA
jgi:hypothetical protein